MIKRILAIVLAVAVLVVAAFAVSQSETTAKPSADHADYTVTGAQSKDSNPKEPQEPMTRAQMASILSRAFDATAAAPLTQY